MRLFNPFAVWSQVPLANRTVRTGDYAEYACTVANAVGTGGSAPTSDVTVVTWTVPADTWLDGQSIIVRVGSLNKFSWTANGNNRYLNFKMSATGAAATTIATVTLASVSTEYVKNGVVELLRRGSAIEAVTSVLDTPLSTLTAGSPSSTSGVTITPTSFASDMAVNLLVNYTADANDTIPSTIYFKPQWAYAYKTTTFRR
jgi:hypothetical protein